MPSLGSAILRGDLASLRDALARGANPNAPQTRDEPHPPLHVAVEEHDLEALRLLVDHGADARGRRRRLDAAARRDRARLVRRRAT